MWNVKTKVIPVIIIEASGTISKSFRKYPRNISESYDVEELQKTAHIPRNGLTIKVQNISDGKWFVSTE
jgi:hypothetical protein